MFSGGIADKLGNSYEAKWLVRQLLDVIGDKSESIRFEGITPEFRGFEFCLKTKDGIEWHQTKINNTNGNWTLNALHREGVLDAFKKRLASSSEDICVFISQHPATKAGDLVSKVKLGNTFEEIEQSVGDGANTSFDELKALWQVDAKTAFEWLKRCRFRTESQPSIDSMIATLSDQYFEQPSDTVFAVLRAFMEKRFNKEITTTIVRDGIRKEAQLTFKFFALDPTIAEQLKTETNEYLKTYIPFGAGNQIIPRTQTQQLAELVANPSGPVVVLLTGTAGSGKSGVIREFIGLLNASAISNLAFRVDHHLECKNPRDLGRETIGRIESPVTTLKRISPEQKSVLIVDQVDAVSEVSGRNGVTKAAVLRLIDDARNLKNVMVVVSCRQFDLENDSQLKALKNNQGVEHIHVPLLEWEAEVKPVLETASVNLEKFTPSQHDLLKLPLNLSLFLETKDVGVPDFTSRNDLFDRLLTKKSRAIRALANKATWEPLAPMSALAEWMSAHQRLDAPASKLAHFAGAADILASEGLIVRSRGNVNFFHESFFDYIYAVTFAERHISIETLLLETEQHLFRRTQVRQILETLRQTDMPRYLTELRSIFSSPNIRFHIQIAVAQWLGTLNDPSAEEFEIANSFDHVEGAFSPLAANALLSSAGWFDALNKNGWLKLQLEGAQTERVNRLLSWLTDIAGQRPTEVATLLEKWWGNHPARGTRLLDWFGTIKRKTSDDALVELGERLLRSNPPGLFDDYGSGNRDLLLHPWAEGDHRGLVKILSAYFDVWFETHPGQHPFEREEFRLLEMHAFQELANNAPAAFLKGTVSAFARTIDMICYSNLDGTPDYTFAWRFQSQHHYGADGFLNMFRSALAKLATTNPSEAIEILHKIDPNRHEVFTHIWLETIAVGAAEFAPFFVILFDCPHIFRAGWHGAEWLSLAMAAKSALPHLNAKQNIKFETLVLNHKPELALASKIIARNKQSGEPIDRQWVVHYLANSGRQRWSILETIGEEKLTPRSICQLAVLRRKFKKEAIQSPQMIEASFVQSPIKTEKAKLMTDEQWLIAIARYNNDDDRRRRPRTVEGGAHQLSIELKEVAKAEPARFVTFLSKLAENSNPAYMRQILWGLAEAKDLNLEDCRHAIVTAHANPARQSGSEIVRLIEKRPEVASFPEVFQILLWYLENGEVSDQDEIELNKPDKEIGSINDVLGQQRFHGRGINEVRGSAAEALGQVLWQVPEVIPLAWIALEKRATVEPKISVRCCLMRSAAPLYNYDKARCAALLEKLSNSPSETPASSVFQPIWASTAFPHARLPNPIKRLSVGIASTIERFQRKQNSKRNCHDANFWCAPLVSHYGVGILPYFLCNQPEVGKKLLFRLMTDKHEGAQQVGAWLVFCQRFQDIGFAPYANQLAKSDVVYRRFLADVASQAVHEHELRDSAEEQLKLSFNDDDKQVRRHAVDVFRRIEPSQFDRYRDLISVFLKSKAYEGDAYGFFELLKKAEGSVVEFVIEAAERLMLDIETEGNKLGRRSMDLHQLQDFIKTEYTASEREPALRTRILNLIDKMLGLQIYGAQEIVGAHER
jgi:ATPase family associated with various cellular activities (AAA)